jgi:ElaB/YqjD/DUF883 family membrane-anchored ribosome-binding protein
VKEGKNMNNTKSFEDKADGIRERTAESLESAADSVRAAGNESANAISGLANEAGEKLDSTATYVRSFPGGHLLSDLRHNVRRNPVGSLAVAAAVGILAGFACRGSRSRSSSASQGG